MLVYRIIRISRRRERYRRAFLYNIGTYTVQVRLYVRRNITILFTIIICYVCKYMRTYKSIRYTGMVCVCVYGNCLTASNHACTKNVDFRDTSIVSFMFNNNILAYNIILYSHIGYIKSTKYIWIFVRFFRVGEFIDYIDFVESCFELSRSI
jgi:hypothetical protein